MKDLRFKEIKKNEITGAVTRVKPLCVASPGVIETAPSFHAFRHRGGRSDLLFCHWTFA
jgi:hypothetical protein